MSILKAITLLLGIADALLKRAERKALIEQGAAMAVREGLEKSRAEIHNSAAARRAVDSDPAYRCRVRKRAARGTGGGEAG